MGASDFTLRAGLQQAPYNITPLDSNGAATTLDPGSVVTLTPTDPTEVLVVPSPADPTGLTGTLVAQKAGPVELDASVKNADGTVATGKATGTITPGEPVSLSVSVGAAVAIPPATPPTPPAAS